MILRFKSNEDYLAFNTKSETYTTKKELVCKYTPLEVSDVAFYKILAELDFNSFDYNDKDFE